MGLSICRSIVHAHGGRLWADANEPRGAVFQFVLPGAEEARRILFRRSAGMESRMKTPYHTASIPY